MGNYPPKIPRSFGTHDGAFHADEVTACALLLHFGLIDEDKIVRTRDSELLSTCDYVCDVGGIYDPSLKLFDHHQSEYQGPLSSAGMILNYLFETQTISELLFNHLRQSLMIGVDAHDNGRDPLIPGYCTFSHVVSNFNPISYDLRPKEQTDAFHEALQFVKGHLKRMMERFDYTHSCREIVLNAMKSKGTYLLFDESMPWLEVFFELNGLNHPALFVIMPSGEHWKLRGIPPSYEDRMKVRLALPNEWAGLLEEELKKKTQIPGAVFCHKGRFVSVWETKEEALKALDYTLKNAKEEDYDNNFRKNYKR